MKSTRSKQVEARLFQARRSNKRYCVFLAVVAVIGAWGGHKRIQDRIKARENVSASVVPDQKQIARPAIQITLPASAGSTTRKAVEQVIGQ